MDIKKGLKKDYLILPFLFSGLVLLILSGGYIDAVNHGLKLWALTVVPAVFPYAFLASTIREITFEDYAMPKKTPVFSRLFNLSSYGLYTLFIGLIAGCPTGTTTVVALKNSKRLTDEESVVASAFSSVYSPMFLISGVGKSAFNSTAFGVVLYLTGVCSCLIVGLIFAKVYKPNLKDLTCKNNLATKEGNVVQPRKSQGVFLGSLTSSVNSLLIMGGVLVLASIVTEILGVMGVLALPVNALFKVTGDYALSKGLVLGLIESSIGFNFVASASVGFWTAPICAFIASFGGVFLIAESVAVLKSAKIKTAPFVLAKILQAVINFLICVVMNLLVFKVF